MASSGESLDFYQILSVSRDASAADIKIAYHRALLLFHPDKNGVRSADSRTPSSISISQIKEAYIVLSTPSLRAEYNSSRHIASTSGPRPAQLISLDDFEESVDRDMWRYRCRCGGVYSITTSDMEEGHHLVRCNSCSEVIWVGYEQRDSEDEGINRVL
ncbi:DnaJ-domain-containing protein [Tricholoma matsutake]|nr:DnaJ-domain-containing protein [Tricholoma matsutake 945]